MGCGFLAQGFGWSNHIFGGVLNIWIKASLQEETLPHATKANFGHMSKRHIAKAILAWTSPGLPRSTSDGGEPGQTDDTWFTGTRHAWLRLDFVNLESCNVMLYLQDAGGRGRYILLTMLKKIVPILNLLREPYLFIYFITALSLLG